MPRGRLHVRIAKNILGEIFDGNPDELMSKRRHWLVASATYVRAASSPGLDRRDIVEDGHQLIFMNCERVVSRRTSKHVGNLLARNSNTSRLNWLPSRSHSALKGCARTSKADAGRDRAGADFLQFRDIRTALTCVG